VQWLRCMVQMFPFRPHRPLTSPSYKRCLLATASCPGLFHRDRTRRAAGHRAVEQIATKPASRWPPCRSSLAKLFTDLRLHKCDACFFHENNDSNQTEPTSKQPDVTHAGG
jgi:hypothetical protein